MSRKYNPWVAMMGLLLGLLLVVLCAGCASVEATEPAEENARFIVEKYVMINSTYGIRIITDTETGVQYLAYVCGQGVGLTVLQEGEG